MSVLGDSTLKKFPKQKCTFPCYIYNITQMCSFCKVYYSNSQYFFVKLHFHQSAAFFHERIWFHGKNKKEAVIGWTIAECTSVFIGMTAFAAAKTAAVNFHFRKKFPERSSNKKKKTLDFSRVLQARDGIRTRDPRLGKAILHHWATRAYSFRLSASGWWESNPRI